MRTLLILLILLFPRVAKADAPVIWFGLWAKSLTANGLEARGLKLDKDATASSPWTLVIPSPALVTSWTMTLPTNAGLADFVLRSDGLGVTSWADPASLISGTANTFAGFDNTGTLGSIPNWLWDNTYKGANVQIGVTPVTNEGNLDLHIFRTSLNPAANVVNSTWGTAQFELNVGTDDSGFSYSADGTGGPNGISVNVNARNKSSVGNIRNISAATQIGNGTDPLTTTNYNGVYNNLSVQDNATMNGQTESYTADIGIGTTGLIDNYTWGRGNINSLGTITYLNGLNLGGNIPTLTQYMNGISLNYNFVNSNGINGFNSNISVSGTNTNGYQPFAAFGTLANSNGISTFGDNLNVTNESNGYTSFRANPNITQAGSYAALSAAPNITNVDNVTMIDTAGNGTVNNWTDVNLHPNLTLVTDGYKGINATPVAVGDGSGYATVGYFDASQLTNFSTDQILAIQTQGNAQINGKLNAFVGITPVDQGGNPNAVHSLVSGVTTTPNATTANVDTIGVNTASLMTISTNSINTSGPFGLGLAALALPAVLKTETGSSIDFVNGGVFALSLDATSTGGTVDELNSGRFTAIPQGGTMTINKLHLVKADLPFGDPAVKSWGFYGSSTTSENWFAKNIKIGGTANTSDFVSDSASVLEVQGGSINVLNGQLKTSTSNGNIYITPNGTGAIAAQIPDSTAAGGNARGTYAVDLQTFRNNADEVASANVSVVIGAANKAANEFSMALGGVSNYATADKAVTLGGSDNTAAHVGAYVFGTGGLSVAAGDFVFSDGSAPSSAANNYFRLAGDTHSISVGVTDTGGASGFDNAINLHARDSGQQDKFIGLKAPDTVTTSTTFVLPNGDGTANQCLKTDGSGNLGWVSIPSPGSTFLAADGTVSAPGYAFNSETNTGLYRIGAGSLGISVNGGNVGSLTSGGAVSFGSASGATFSAQVGTNKFGKVLDTKPSNITNPSDLTTFGTMLAVSPTDGDVANYQGMFTYTATATNKLAIASRSGLTFADGGAGDAGGYSSNGNWFFGNSTSTTGAHKFYGSSANIRVDANTNTNAQFYFQENGANKWAFQNENSTDAYEIYAGASTLVGSIAQNGAYLIGPASGSGIYQEIRGNSSGGTAILLNNTQASDAGTGTVIKNGMTSGTFGATLAYTDGANQVGGFVSHNTSADTVSYTNSSDARLKTKFEHFDGLELLAKMQPLKYERFSDPGVKEIGFVAQDLYEVYPQAVTQGGEDPKTRPWGIDYGKLTPVLAQAIQELKAELDEAKAEIAILKQQRN
jgi:hypothetical protein